MGSTAGTLYAISTCGSIFGTLLTAFYLIPVLGVSNIIHALGITLVCLSLVVVPLLRLQRISLGRAVAAVSVLLGSVNMWAPIAWAKTILQKDTFYHRIRIEEDDEARYMYFDRTLQSAMTLKDPAALRLLYSRYTSIGFTFRPDAKKMLLIGLGGGSIPKKLNKEFPNMEIDAVEIDPEVVKMAKDHFNVKEGKNLRIHAQDGRLISQPNADSIRHHLARRLFHRLHAVSSCDQAVF